MTAATTQQLTKVEQTRGRLLDAALVVFARKGVHDSRVEDFCTTARVARATFYRHFDNKQAVFLALYEAMSEELRGTAAQLQPVTADEAGLETLREWVDELLAITERWGPLVEVLSRPADATSPIRRRSVALTAEFAQSVGRRFVDGKVAGVDAGLAALGVIAMTDCFGHQMRTWGMDLDRETIVELLAALTLKMLHPKVDLSALSIGPTLSA